MSEMEEQKPDGMQLKTNESPKIEDNNLKDSPDVTGELNHAPFSPKIIGFLCNWCTYAGADLAGVSRYQYPTDIRVVRIMCSTRLDPVILLETLLNGADGIFIGGCHLGDCHYISGNYHTVHKLDMTKQLLELAKVDNRRVRLEWISASEGQRFANLIQDFIDEIKGLGPSPISASLHEEDRDKNILNSMRVAKNAAMGFRLRSVVARIRKSVQEGNVYGEKLPQERFEELMGQIIKDEFIRSGILVAVEKNPKTVEEIADEIGISTEIIFKNIARLWKKQVVLPSGNKGHSPTYMGGIK
jgi:coenzyme F420-reducing hydrogenase delta subunit